MATVNPVGFTLLTHSDPTANRPYRVNIIFIHGLRGHPQHTWEADQSVHDKNDSNGDGNVGSGSSSPQASRRSLFHRMWALPASSGARVFWPRDFLAEDMPEARVWTYGYNAGVTSGLFQASNQNSVSQHGRDLAVRLESDIDNSEPLVFVVHSLGGIITKDALHKSPKSLSRTKFIVFLGTPHRGSRYAGWGGIMTNIAGAALHDMNKGIVRTLEVNGEVLDIIHNEFRKDGAGIAFHSFQEGRSMLGIKGVHKKVVEDFSSTLDMPSETVESIDANHREMVRCRSRDDPRYIAISKVLFKFVRQEELGRNSAHPQAVPAPASAPASAPVELDAQDRPPQCPVHYSIPLLRNKQFVGREMIIDRLRSLFFSRGCQVAAIAGLGGMGKTQVALQIAYWVKENKPAYSVMWLSAQSMETFEQSCRAVVDEFQLRVVDEKEDARSTVKRHLSTERSGMWFLVVDNADDKDLLFGESAGSSVPGIRAYLPQRDGGLTLFTTRHREIAAAVVTSMDHVVDLKEMTQEEALALWQTLGYRDEDLGRDDSDDGGDDGGDDGEDTFALQPQQPQQPQQLLRLLQELTYLPLAIRQAVAFISVHQISVEEYLDLLHGTEQDAVELFDYEFHDSTRYDQSKNAVASTWLVSFNKIRTSDSRAADLLSFIACIEPKAIPHSLLPDFDSKVQQTRAIGTLCAYSFLTKHGVRSPVYDMHSLVHLATQKWLQGEGRMASALVLAESRFVDLFGPRYPQNWSARRAYGPHLVKLSLQIPVTSNTVLYYVLHMQASMYLFADGRSKEASHHAQTAYQIAVSDNTMTITNRPVLALCLLVDIYVAAGDARKIKEVTAALECLRHNIQHTHFSTLDLLYALGRGYIHTGQAEKAIALIKNVMAAAQNAHAENRAPRLTPRLFLAFVDAFKAIPMLEESEAIQRHTRAEDHLGRHKSLFELTLTNFANGQVTESIILLKEIVAIQRRTLAEDHPGRLESLYSLALVYLGNGQATESIVLLEEIVAIQKHTLAEDHPGRIAGRGITLSIRKRKTEDVSGDGNEGGGSQTTTHRAVSTS